MPPKAAASALWKKAGAIAKTTVALSGVAAEAAAETKEKKCKERLEDAAGGFADWVLDAGNLILELKEVLEEESQGLRLLFDAAEAAALSLNDTDWESFGTMPRDRIHQQDHVVLTGLFSTAEPQWRTLLTQPKKGSTCVFFHIGSEPPSLPICELLTKLGWFGVVVSPTPPAEGNEDRITHIDLDPTSEKDEEDVTRLQEAKGSLVPKPLQFSLSFADILWDTHDGEADDEGSLWKQIDVNDDSVISKKEFRRAQKDGIVSEDIKFKSIDINKDGMISRQEFEMAQRTGILQEDKPKEESPEKPLANATGYGILGVTRHPKNRWRLRVIRNILGVALQRLSAGGTLVVTWHGLPHHPVLMFITAQLRPVFLRVHVLVQEGTKTWEVYILAASFKRAEAEETAMKGGTGFMFRNFIKSAYRDPDLDDCLLWTLPRLGLLEEYRLGGGERTIAKGYNDLWITFAQKFRDLAKEFATAALPPPSAAAAAKSQAKAKTKSPTKGKAKRKAKARAKQKSQEKAADEEDAEEPESAAAEGTKLPPIAAPKAQAKAKAKPEEDILLGKPAEDATLKKPGVFRPSRSMPSLATTLGASPGVPIGRPHWQGMGEKWPLIKRAVSYLEEDSPLVGRLLPADLRQFMDRETFTAVYGKSDAKNPGEGEDEGE